MIPNHETALIHIESLINNTITNGCSSMGDHITLHVPSKYTCITERRKEGERRRGKKEGRKDGRKGGEEKRTEGHRKEGNVWRS